MVLISEKNYHRAQMPKSLRSCAIDMETWAESFEPNRQARWLQKYAKFMRAAADEIECQYALNKDMLAALKEISKLDGGHDLPDAWEYVRAAIASAEGSKP